MRYRTIKDPAVQGRMTVKEVEDAVRALDRKSVKSLKTRLHKRGQNGGSSVAKKAAGKATKRS